MHINKNKSKNAGFTLMEILVVMVIIGILVSIGVNTFIGSQQKGRDSRRKEDLQQITTALEVYYNDHGQYPESTEGGNILGCGNDPSSRTPCAWGQEFENENGTYMVQIPNDPVDGLHYYYQSEDDTDFTAGQYYRLYAKLENEQDKDLERNDDDNVKVFDGTQCSDSGQKCNYVIGSTNRQLPAPNDP